MQAMNEDQAYPFAWSSATAGLEARNRRPAERNGAHAHDIEALDGKRPTPQEEKHLRRIAVGLFRLDLCAAQTIMEVFTREARLQEIGPHFTHLWNEPPPVKLIESWLDSDGLYHPENVMELSEFRHYLDQLSYDQLMRAVAKQGAHGFYIRMIGGRVWKLKERKSCLSIAAQNFPGAYAANLGLRIGEKPTSVDEYHSLLSRNQSIAESRLRHTLREARTFRDQVTMASKEKALSNQIQESLILRANALHVYYEEACELVGENHSKKFLDPLREVWLNKAKDQKKNPGSAKLVFIALLVSLVALYFAWLATIGTPKAPGAWMDASFCSLLASSFLQLLGLGLLVLGPLVSPITFQNPLSQEGNLMVSSITVLTVVLTGASIFLYGLLSARWSLITAFLGQIMMVLIQSILVFGS